MATDKNNICRDINKMAVASFLSEFKAVNFEPSFDRLMTFNERDLNTIMPIINSVQLWGRYKQQFNEQVNTYSLYHVAPEAG